MRKIKSILSLACTLWLFSCEQKTIKNEATTPVSTTPVSITPVSISYHLSTEKNYLKEHALDSIQAYILLAINRTDSQYINLITSIVVPDTFTRNIQDYSPFPQRVASLDSINKIIFFSYASQFFGAYENGKLIYTGATNMGRKDDPTPTGLFFTNWKAEETHSTFNDEWDLKWNFNIENKEGIGWHQYSLPGYPASHSCMRLSEKDARYLYNWAEQWVTSGRDSIITKGTPVIVFGTYNYKGVKPWLQLISNKHVLDIPADTLANIIKPYKDSIMIEQTKQKIKSAKSGN